ncbi:MAG: family oxidoreductase [Frankiales bacterium]|nr:family oxidoreductase [Frankiales bacterium]
MTPTDTDQRMSGLVVVVTGAGTEKGIGNGQATAITLARHGAAVVCVDKIGERAESVAQSIRKDGGSAVSVEADVTSIPDTERIAADALSNFGQVDGLVNVAGVVSKLGLRARIPGGPLAELENLDMDDWDFVYRVNVTGAMLCIRALGPALRKNGGAIVNVGTTMASLWYGGGGSIAYSTSKAALEGLTLTIAGAFGPSRVRANLLVIGQVRAPHIDAAAERMGEAGEKMLETRRVSGLLQTDGTPWDVANTALYLTSPDSSWITAQTIFVDAGASHTMR